MPRTIAPINTYPQGVKLDQENNRIFLPKLGWMRSRNSREIIGVVKNVTVSQSCGKWYVSIQTEYEASEPQHESTSMVGLDAGVTKLATLSDGTVYQPVNSFKVSQRKLATLQRQLSRKVKFSANWQKQKRKIQRLHSHIANIRRDYLHKVTTEISKNHAMIAIEDLKVSNMSKSAKGTAEQPGRNVRTKSGLNRSILDQGWYEMRCQLEYKNSIDPRLSGKILKGDKADFIRYRIGDYRLITFIEDEKLIVTAITVGHRKDF